jgi:hypothetical protein
MTINWALHCAAILEEPFDALAGRSEVSVMQEKLMYVLFYSSWESALSFQLLSESASTPTKLGDLIDVVLAHMPERIFQLACLLPLSDLKLVRKYKRVTDDWARQLVAQHGDNNDDESSFVSHLCGYPI